MKKKTKTTLTKKLDKVFSKEIRSKGYCVRCENTETLQACHIFSRKNRSVRWDRDNVLCMCARCHFWGHANPVLFTEFVREYLGEEKYTNLKLKANTPRKFTHEELEEMIKLYE